MTHYKFVSWDVPAFETILTGRIPAGVFLLRNICAAFWVKTKYCGIIEMYALNKTDIRKELKSNVIEIMEVKKN